MSNNQQLQHFITQMPKVEIHVHLEGATQPETLLELARRHNINLPADTVDGIRDWYQFTDFDHFIEVYLKVSECIQTTEDIEWLAKQFLKGQAEQNIRYTEATYTAYTHYWQKGLDVREQLLAINRAIDWAEAELGVSMGLVIDIARGFYENPEVHEQLAHWVIANKDLRVVAFGLGGPEVGHPPEDYVNAFQIAYEAGLPSVPHAGETEGPASIWGAIRALNAVRIGHGVRCLEDPELVDYLRDHQIPLEVNPTSNICLGVFESFDKHPLPKLIHEGLYVTVNSDDPPMFNTTLTNEYQQIAYHFGFDANQIKGLVMNGLNATFLPADKKQAMRAEFEAEFQTLRQQVLDETR